MNARRYKRKPRACRHGRHFWIRAYELTTVSIAHALTRNTAYVCADCGAGKEFPIGTVGSSGTATWAAAMMEAGFSLKMEQYIDGLGGSK